VIRDPILKFAGPSVRSDIKENQPIEQEGLSERVRTQRPDMVFERQARQGRVLEIMEFSSPYGYISHERDTLEAVYTHKKEKYEELASELRNRRRQQ
jgi:hypothetical protein